MCLYYIASTHLNFQINKPLDLASIGSTRVGKYSRGTTCAIHLGRKGISRRNGDSELLAPGIITLFNKHRRRYSAYQRVAIGYLTSSQHDSLSGIPKVSLHDGMATLVDLWHFNVQKLFFYSCSL